VKLFLANLEKDKAYVLIFELFLSEFHENDIPVITLSEPILITKNSNPALISKFLINQTILASERFDLDYELIKDMRLDKGAPYIRVKYNEIKLF
jgi:hypothetical protein